MTQFIRPRSFIGLTHLACCLSLISCQVQSNSLPPSKPQVNASATSIRASQTPQSASPSPKIQATQIPNNTPTPPLATLNPSISPSSSPSASPVLAASASPSPNIEPSPSASSPFFPLSSEDTKDIDQLFGPPDNSGSELSIEQEQTVYQDLFQSDQSEVEDFVSFELTTDGGALLLGDDLDFSVMALNLLTAPKAWVRKDLRQIKQRVHIKAIDADHLVMRLVRDLKGEFLIERDSTILKLNPGRKKINDRLIKRLDLKRIDGRWKVDKTSSSIVIPSSISLNAQPQIRFVRLSNANTLQEVFKLDNPLKTIAKDQLPNLPANKKLLLEVKLKDLESEFQPTQFVYLHAFNRRLRLNDAGLQGDQQAGDGIYSREVQTPAALSDRMYHLAVDVLPSATMADETADNYQSMIWLIPFKGSSNP